MKTPVARFRYFNVFLYWFRVIARRKIRLLHTTYSNTSTIRNAHISRVYFVVILFE